MTTGGDRYKHYYRESPLGHFSLDDSLPLHSWGLSLNVVLFIIIWLRDDKLPVTEVIIRSWL